MAEAGAQARLDGSGLSLWLTDWKVTLGAWRNRRLIALHGGFAAGNLDFEVHPSGQAVTVSMVSVDPGYARRGIASVLMDALYAAYPAAWINHGLRTPEGTKWWNGYRDPAPERNIHNRPPAEWARYFDAREVSANRASNAFFNGLFGLEGHRGAEYRYGERTEEEAGRWAPAFRPVATPPGADPSVQGLYGSAVLSLRPGLHRYVHDSSRDAAERAAVLLEHVGHGNLPHAHTPWNTTARAAFDDAAQLEMLQDDPSRPATHVVFQLRPLSADQQYEASASFVEFCGTADVPVEVASMAWRSPEQPWRVHSAAFPAPVTAALAPLAPQHASAAYQARYDERGHRRQPAEHVQGGLPYASRAQEIRAVADALITGAANRALPLPPSAPPGRRPTQPDPAQVQAQPRSTTPRR
ncbi:GNAT family N-acetyltransferase [Streptomyces sp. NPDC059991]|uniref:GNAT family N-acetyltransferase n=1 Tax=unclassified Streptomyces TaxID=2593676 RepID=UPI003679DCFF